MDSNKIRIAFMILVGILSIFVIKVLFEMNTSNKTVAIGGTIIVLFFAFRIIVHNIRKMKKGND